MSVPYTSFMFSTISAYPSLERFHSCFVAISGIFNMAARYNMPCMKFCFSCGFHPLISPLLAEGIHKFWPDFHQIQHFERRTGRHTIQHVVTESRVPLDSTLPGNDQGIRKWIGLFQTVPRIAVILGRHEIARSDQLVELVLELIGQGILLRSALETYTAKEGHELPRR